MIEAEAFKVQASALFIWETSDKRVNVCESQFLTFKMEIVN
jgi:hypothetical protein